MLGERNIIPILQMKNEFGLIICHKSVKSMAVTSLKWVLSSVLMICLVDTVDII